MSKDAHKPEDHTEIELEDDALELAAGGFSDSGPQTNTTTIVYASTFIPFDSSF